MGGARSKASGLSRRAVLKGMLGGAAVTVGLPALEIFLNAAGTAYAAGDGLPTRFGLFYWGNGMLPHRWVPRGEGREWALSDQLAPLAGVKDEVTVVSGMSVKVANAIPHHSGSAGLLTGAQSLGTNDDHTFALPSIDQLIAAEIGKTTRFRSIEFGSVPGAGLSYNGPNSMNPPEDNPFRLFERVFGAGFRAPGEQLEVDPKIALRRSVLDAVIGDAGRLKGRLGATDKVRLDQHLEGVRALELQLARLQEDPPELAACARPGQPPEIFEEIDGRPQLSAINRAMCDTVAMALACDQVRVFSNYFSGPLTNVLFRGANAGHHQLTHDEPGDQPQVHEIVVQIIEEYAYMVEALRRVPEGDSTLLDHCAVLGVSEISLGRNHSLDDMPILIAGSAGGILKKGIHYRSHAGENTSKVMLSLVRAMGIRRGEFGLEAGQATEGLSEIEV